MRVELKIDSGCKEPCAVIQAEKMSPTLQTAVSILEKEGEDHVIAAQRDGKIFLLDPETVELVRTEGRELAIYDRQKGRYTVSRPLYELEELLGKGFVRISKSALAQIRSIRHVEASYNGTMELMMKNGMSEVLTRSYRQTFRQRLGV